jgi:hypothetical protein
MVLSWSFCFGLFYLLVFCLGNCLVFLPIVALAWKNSAKDSE